MKVLAILLALLGGTASADTLRIATGGHYPPYIYNPTPDEAAGLDKDLLGEICARGDFDCTWVDLPMSDIFQALARGEVDVVTGGFGYSDERDALVVAVSEQATALRNTLDAILADMSSDGTLGEIQQRWLGYDEGDVISRCLDLNALT